MTVKQTGAQYAKEVKEARTIKVKTVVVATAFVLVALTTFALGWFTRSNFDATIKAQVTAQVTELTSKE